MIQSTQRRPDLSEASPDIVAYIEALEDELARLQAKRSTSRASSQAPAPAEPTEPPTTMQVISVSAAGVAKRTARHLYQRQRRGGMGIFDLETSGQDHPRFLAVADISDDLLLITSRGRAFRIAVESLEESPVRGRGANLPIKLHDEESWAVVVGMQDFPYLSLVTDRGHVRRYARNAVGPQMRPGQPLYDVQYGGTPAAACWTSGKQDLFIVTLAAQSIRFSEQQVPTRGCLGIRPDRDDPVVGITGVDDDDGVFLLSAAGLGTIRQIAQFRANKSPGASGKLAMKADAVVSAIKVEGDDDVFILSELGKLIRFKAADVPTKSGVVQGVRCMDLRADQCVALTGSS